MLKKIFALTMAVLFCISTVQATSIEAPGSIIVFGAPKDVLITVKNTDPIEKTLRINFFGPTNSDFFNVPGTIQPNSDATIILRVFPNKGLEGQTYTSTLTAEIGNMKISRKINIAFKPVSEEEQTEPEPNPDLDYILIGLVSLANFGTENALNIILAFIAALLLIAFIARFLRRIH